MTRHPGRIRGPDEGWKQEFERVERIMKKLCP